MSANGSREYIDEAIELAVAMCKRFEGFYSRPYLCPAGVPTISYGATRYADGRAVTLSDPPMSRTDGEQLLRHQLRSIYLKQTVALCPGADTPERLAALLDFAYNLGAANLKQSTLRRKVNAQDWAEARIQIRRWNRASGKVLRGLTLRREAEAQLL